MHGFKVEPALIRTLERVTKYGEDSRRGFVVEAVWGGGVVLENTGRHRPIQERQRNDGEQSGEQQVRRASPCEPLPA